MRPRLRRLDAHRQIDEGVHNLRDAKVFDGLPKSLHRQVRPFWVDAY